jgi:hypothetical protein
MRLLRYAPSDSSTYFEYAYGVLGRKPCIHIRLDLLATNPCENCGLIHHTPYLVENNRFLHHSLNVATL